MDIKTAGAAAAELLEKAERDGDALLVVYFSRSDDKYDAGATNLDAGDALIVIGRLIETFNLSREAIAAM